MDFLSVPLGYAIFFINKIFSNYGVSIIIFTIILKLLMTPLQIKQQKATARISAFNPLIAEINKKYRNNIQKRNEELQKFYSSHKLNPGAGCLTSIVPMFVLIGMIGVVERPLTHVLHMSNDLINRAIEIFKSFEPIMFVGKTARQTSRLMTQMANSQLDLINNVVSNPGHYSSLGQNFIDSVNSIDLNFLGLNISEKASLFNFSVIISILSLTFSFLQMWLMLKQNSMPQGMKMGKIMLFIMPVFSFGLTLSLPIGISIYWITNYVVQIFQTILLNKFYDCEEIKDQALKELENIKKNKKPGGLTNKQMKFSSKERLDLARKHLQDKFGD